ncbi:uncharacterized protein MONBRDRAFT_33132 [Monosiga brevicollis MX1]|uniref:MAPEG family protein n=1 Tax=Monosiga brevicollis TaxID=81824 RepID=A9V3W5_MONBE|nr:uncharacterized protein MONBRDRAFT_33132 [Monosiga brevicollis MX1]EDQ87876.1 predicted protein [Monosiga brevicollis MX1]|eukprot:XP_001747409.1 hypothetical protein [Monosiga brevicollis MX1]
MSDTPLVCLFLALVLIYVPSTIKAIWINRNVDGGVNNIHPRKQLDLLASWGLRAYGAHQNSLETFPAFVAGIYAAQVQNADETATDVLCILFVVFRVLYIIVYLINTNACMAALRTILFVLSMACVIGLFIAGFVQ